MTKEQSKIVVSVLFIFDLVMTITFIVPLFIIDVNPKGIVVIITTIITVNAIFALLGWRVLKKAKKA